MSSGRSGRPGGWSADDSWTVRSGWGWRAMFMMALLAVGAAIVFLTNHLNTLAVLWLVIAAGWFAFSMWLWRRHAKLYR